MTIMTIHRLLVRTMLGFGGSLVLVVLAFREVLM